MKNFFITYVHTKIMRLDYTLGLVRYLKSHELLKKCRKCFHYLCIRKCLLMFGQCFLICNRKPLGIFVTCNVCCFIFEVLTSSHMLCIFYARKEKGLRVYEVVNVLINMSVIYFCTKLSNIFQI